MENSYRILNEKVERLNIPSIFDGVSQCLGIELNDIIGKCRKRDFADARKIGIKICIDILNQEKYADEYKHGYSAIGRYLNLGHADIIHLYKRSNEFIEIDNGFRRKFNACIELRDKMQTRFNSTGLKRDEFLITN